MTAYYWNHKEKRYQDLNGNLVNPAQMADGATFYGSEREARNAVQPPKAPQSEQSSIPADVHWNDKAKRYQDDRGKFVNPANPHFYEQRQKQSGNTATATKPKASNPAETDTGKQIVKLLELQLKESRKNYRKLDRFARKIDSNIGLIRLAIAWTLALGAYAYPTVLSGLDAAKDPIGTILGTNSGSTTDAIYSTPIEEGATIDGYQVTSGFGKRGAVATNLGESSTDHKGVDLAAPSGTQLYMIGLGKGTVDCLSQPDGAGNYAKITPAGIPLTFEAFHLSKCSPGEYDPGQIFAATGGGKGEQGAGNSSGEHLHWQQQNPDGTPVQPTEGYLWWALKGEQPKPYAATAQTGLSSATDLYSRIIKQESGGDASQINPDTGAIGIGQVMPENVPSWTKEAIGQEMTADQFAADADAQKKVVDFKLNQYMENAKAAGESGFEACRTVAKDWYAGEGGDKDSTAPQAGYPSIADYTKSVCAGYKE